LRRLEFYISLEWSSGSARRASRGSAWRWRGGRV